jgi:hypothetical protein
MGSEIRQNIENKNSKFNEKEIDKTKNKS